MYESAVDGIYTATLSASLSSKQSPQDPWGNVKIPTYESLATQPDEFGFKSVTRGNETDWVSLLGLPMTGLRENERATSTISTRYYYLNCSRLFGVDGTTNWPVNLNLSNVNNDYNNTNIWWANTLNDNYPAQYRLLNVAATHDYGVQDTRSIPYLFIAMAGVLRGSDGAMNLPSNATIGECTIEPSYIDVQVACEGFACVSCRRSNGNNTG